MRGGGGEGRHAYEEFTRLTRYVMARTAHSQTITAHHPTTVRVPHAASRGGGHTGPTPRRGFVFREWRHSSSSDEQLLYIHSFPFVLRNIA